jgi:NADH-quinone oxidoreductase subunit L
MSKDAILFEALHGGHSFLFWLGLGSAFLTAFYMTRMVWLCFMGEPRNRHKYEHAHESPWVMTVPLVVLAALSVGFWFRLTDAGFENKFFSTPAYHADHPQEPHVTAAYAEPGAVLQHGEHPDWFTPLAIAVALGGLLVGWQVFRSGRRDHDSVVMPAGVHRLAKAKYYLDEFYVDGFVGSWNKVSDLCRVMDDGGVDGAVNAVGRGGVIASEVSGDHDQIVVDGAVNLVADVAEAAGAVAVTSQTGRLRNYLFGAIGVTTAVLLVLLL